VVRAAAGSPPRNLTFRGCAARMAAAAPRQASRAHDTRWALCAGADGSSSGISHCSKQGAPRRISSAAAAVLALPGSAKRSSSQGTALGSPAKPAASSASGPGAALARATSVDHEIGKGVVLGESEVGQGQVARGLSLRPTMPSAASRQGRYNQNLRASSG